MENQIIADLLAGKVVTVPTETVEGFAVGLDSEQGIRELMVLKRRDYDSDKIFTLVPESREAISKNALIPAGALGLIEQYVPGELTLILPKNPEFHHFYYDEFEKRGRKIGIGVRIPDYSLFEEILPKVGPLILTSANARGGKPKSITGHKPSTIVDFTGETPRIIRQGNLYLGF